MKLTLLNMILYSQYRLYSAFDVNWAHECAPFHCFLPLTIPLRAVRHLSITVTALPFCGGVVEASTAEMLGSWTSRVHIEQQVS